MVAILATVAVLVDVDVLAVSSVVAEPLPLARRLVDALVVDARRPHCHGARPRRRPCARAAVADHQPPPGLVDLIDQAGDVVDGLGFQRRGDHPLRALASEVIKRDTGLLGAVPHPANICHGLPPCQPHSRLSVLTNREGTPGPGTVGLAVGGGAASLYALYAAGVRCFCARRLAGQFAAEAAEASASVADQTVVWRAALDLVERLVDKDSAVARAQEHTAGVSLVRERVQSSSTAGSPR